MFENILKFFKKAQKNKSVSTDSKSTAKERLHLVLMQDRANVSADFLDLMKQEIIEVIKKYIEVDESAIDVRLTNKENEDGTNGAPALYANIPILNIKNEARKIDNVANTNNDEKERKLNNQKDIKDDEEQIVNKMSENKNDVIKKEDAKEKEETGKIIDKEEVKTKKDKEVDKKKTNNKNDENLGEEPKKKKTDTDKEKDVEKTRLKIKSTTENK